MITHPDVCEAIKRDIRDTSMSYKAIAEKYRVGPNTVTRLRRELKDGTYPPRQPRNALRRVQPDERAAILKLIKEGVDDAVIAAQFGFHVRTICGIRLRDVGRLKAIREAAAAEAVPAPAPPISHFDRWAAEYGETVARSMERLRAAPGILPVSEAA